MKVEELARKMRERAIAIEANEPPKKDPQIDRRREERISKLYFHAGRWAGGARDNTAKEAFQRIALGENNAIS